MPGEGTLKSFDFLVETAEARCHSYIKIPPFPSGFLFVHKTILPYVIELFITYVQSNLRR